MSIKNLESGRNNNFNLIRFIAATMVIFSHSFWLTGNENSEPLGKLINLVNFGSLGVTIFFSVSGYLITKSLYRQERLNGFVWARVLRIFPGLFVSSILCVFIIGPICTTLPLKEYFNNSSLLSFLWRQTLLHTYPNTLPGVFLSNPISNNVNSPIWTLPGELFMYLCVFFLGVVLVIRKKKFNKFYTFPLIALVIVFFWGIPYPAAYFDNILSWGILFLSGALFYLFNKHIILSIPVFIAVALLFVVLFHFRFRYIDAVFDIVLTYGIFIFAYHPRFQIKAFYKIGDMSYGLYIYTFPIQQLFVFKIHGITPLPLFFIAFLTAIPLAALSWKYIESPMLKLKHINIPEFGTYM